MAKTKAAVSSPSVVHRIGRYARQQLKLKWYLDQPGDGRLRPQIPSGLLVWAMLMGFILRECSFHAIEALARSRARLRLGVDRSFGDDTLGYLTERLDPAPTRAALVNSIRQAKRNKAFEDTAYIGLLLDGTSAGRSTAEMCPLCRPHRDAKGKISHYDHRFVC